MVKAIECIISEINLVVYYIFIIFNLYIVGFV